MTNTGAVQCWGDDEHGQASPPGGSFIQVSAGETHTCALTSGGEVQCWGNDNYGKTTVPTGLYTQVSAGRDHTCALTESGTLQCWGRNDDGRTNSPTGHFTQVSAGAFHTCALTESGTVQCWGYDWGGSGSTRPPAGQFAQVSTGGAHTCALTDAGAVQCWGDDHFGQANPPARPFSQVSASAGGTHNCALTDVGAVQCWGYDDDGRASPLAGEFTQISAGDAHTCATTTSGAVQCWGRNNHSQSSPPSGLRVMQGGGSQPERYQLSTSVSPSSGGSVSGAGTYDDGTRVTLRANPNSGYRFLRWQGDASGSNSSTTVAMNGDKSVTAHFQTVAPDRYTLSVSASPYGGGSVSGGGTFDSGQTATLTASPASGYTFSRWSGDASGSNSSTTVAMNGDKSVTAHFQTVAPDRYTLSVNTTGSGSVYGGAGSYDSGQTATLYASPADGYTFSRWSGDASGTSNPTTVTMNRNKSATAVFERVVQTRYTLSVSASPSNGGSVYGGVGSYDSGQTATLYASPADGYTFSRWSGDASGTSNPTTVTMNRDKSATAVFERVAPDRYTLSVSASPYGGGSVSGGGTFDSGQTATLTASPASGYTFSRWSGDASGSNSSTTVAMNGDKSVTAHFQTVAPDRYTLSVNTTGSGSVYGGAGSYDSGQTATLYASPADGYTFSRWSGDASGTSNPTTVTMNRNKSATAVFERVVQTRYTLSVSASPSNGGSVYGGVGSYDSGQTATLYASPADGYTFSRWSGDASGTSNPTTVTMNRNKSATAVFERDTEADDREASEDFRRLIEREAELAAIEAALEAERRRKAEEEATTLQEPSTTAKGEGVRETLSAGAYHTCGVVESSAAQCWGSDGTGQSSPPAGDFLQVSAGGLHSCGLAVSGVVLCWGWNRFAQSDPPTEHFMQVSAGGGHNCGLTTSGSVRCWGYDGAGQSSPPTGRFMQISAGGNHTCALTASGSVQCWGSDGAGQSSPPTGRFTQISAGGNHTCALTASDSVQCWGSDAEGQSSPPTGRFTQVSAGGDHTCALTASGSVQCWGSDAEGQSSPPTGRFTQISAGGDHTCALTASGSVQCWGGENFGASSPPNILHVMQGETYATAIETAPQTHPGLEGLSSLSGFVSWTATTPTDAETLARLLPGRTIMLWDGRGWLRYSVVNGAMVPGSVNFRVEHGAVLQITGG